jgi:hypothetical protein
MRKYLHLIIMCPVAVMMYACRPTITPPQPTTPSQPLANVTCNELSFYLEPALGSGYECQAVPESSSSDIPMNIFIYPAHTELTIQDYPLTHTQFSPQVWIFPVNRYNELLPDTLPDLVSELERLIISGSLSSGDLPFLPPIPQTQTFFSHETSISFDGGQGLRFITEYSDGPLPISNLNIIYTFQGLTDDGEYWVAVTLPISSPMLPASYDTLPGGYTQESLIQNYDTYLDEVKDGLEAQAPGSFWPSINSLDNLVESITIR